MLLGKSFALVIVSNTKSSLYTSYLYLEYMSVVESIVPSLANKLTLVKGPLLKFH